MASLTSFEEYFGKVFNSSIPKKRKNKRKRSKNAQNNQNNSQKIKHKKSKSPTKHQHKPNNTNNTSIKTPDTIKSSEKDEQNTTNTFSVFESNQNKKNMSHIKISSYKLKQNKIHRKNSISFKKNQLQSNLKSLGYDTKNMSFLKQRKLLDKAMTELSNKNTKNAKNENNNSENILGFMKNNDLFIDRKQNKNENKNENKMKNKTNNHNNKNKIRSKIIKSDLHGMDLEFGEIVRPNFQREIDMETVIRTGKSNKKISDRKLLKVLKKRDKAIKKRYGNNNNKVFIDEHLVNITMQKLRGERVKDDLKFMKNKLKQKYKKKVKSQRKWKQRIAKKQYSRNIKIARREGNIAVYRQRKSDRRIGNRISAENAIAIANMEL